MSIDGLMNKENVVYTLTHSHTGILSQEKEDMPFTIWMNLEDIMVKEVSQIQKDMYHMISLICGSEKVKYTEAESKFMATRGGKVGEMGR